MALVVFAALCLLWPTEARFRSTWPMNFSWFWSVVDVEYVNPGTVKNFAFYHAPPIILWGGAASAEEIHKIDPEEFLQTHVAALRRDPFLLPDHIILNLNLDAPYGSSTCVVQIELDNFLRSNKVPCAQIAKNPVTRFQFSSLVGPGLRWFRFVEAPSSLKVWAAKYVPTGLVLVPAVSQNQLTLAKAFSWWFSAKPVLAVCYVLLSAIALGLLLFLDKFRGATFVLVMFVVVHLANAVMAPPLVGNDEAAHMDMFHMQLVKAKNLPDSQGKLERLSFYASAREFMLSQNFFRMVEWEPQPANKCPNFTCGTTQRPQNLYFRYVSVLKAFGIHDVSVPQLAYIGRVLISPMLVLLFALVGYFLFAPGVLVGLAFVVLFLGPWHVQFPSVSNDVPMYLLGLVYVGLMASFLIKRFSALQVLLRLAFVSFVLYAFTAFERSWIAGMPSYLFLIMLGAANPWARRIGSVLERRLSFRDMVDVGALFLGSAFLLRLFLPMVIQSAPKAWDALLRAAPDVSMLANIGTLEFFDFLRMCNLHFQSWTGSYMWGHISAPRFAVVLWLAGLVLFSCSAFFAAFLKAKRISLFRPMFLALVFVPVLWFGQLLAVEGIVAPFMAMEVMYPAGLAQARLTAPGGTIFFLLPLLGFLFARNKTWEGFMLVSAGLWSIWLLFFMFPKAYLVGFW